MSQLMRWAGYLGALGRRTAYDYEKRNGVETLVGTRPVIYLTVGLLTGPEAKKDRRVQVELRPEEARRLIEDLTRLVDETGE